MRPLNYTLEMQKTFEIYEVAEKIKHTNTNI